METILLRKSELSKSMLQMARDGNFGKLRLLVESGADVNYSNGDFTSLHWACVRGHVDMVVFLLRNNARHEAVTKQGFTPLHMLCATAPERSDEIAKALLRYGAQVSPETQSDMTPLMLAARSNSPSLCRVLVRAGANLTHSFQGQAISSTSNPRYNGLEWASFSGSPAALRVLLAFHSSWNKGEGINMLRFAFGVGHRASTKVGQERSRLCIATLIACGAHEWESPLLAERIGCEEGEYAREIDARMREEWKEGRVKRLVWYCSREIVRYGLNKKLPPAILSLVFSWPIYLQPKEDAKPLKVLTKQDSW